MVYGARFTIQRAKKRAEMVFRYFFLMTRTQKIERLFMTLRNVSFMERYSIRNATKIYVQHPIENTVYILISFHGPQRAICELNRILSSKLYKTLKEGTKRLCTSNIALYFQKH